MVTLYMFIMRLYGIKRIENENDGIVDFARYKFLDGPQKCGPRVAAGRSFPTPVRR